MYIDAIHVRDKVFYGLPTDHVRYTDDVYVVMLNPKELASLSHPHLSRQKANSEEESDP